MRKDVAMTGEITLRGNVLPIGGVKEKVLAARRARVTTIILPQQNRRDLDEVPKEPFKDIRFVFVDNMRQVFREALGEKVFLRPVRRRGRSECRRLQMPGLPEFNAVMLVELRIQPRSSAANLNLGLTIPAAPAVAIT